MYQKLFTPIKIRSMELKNRIVLPAMGTKFSGKTSYVTDQLIDYHVARVKGGTGLSIVEVCSVPVSYTHLDVYKRQVFGSLQCSGDLRRVVGIIVNDDHAVLCSFIFETTVGSGEGEQPFPGRLKRDLEKICRSDRCQCIGNIVSARNG